MVFDKIINGNWKNNEWRNGDMIINVYGINMRVSLWKSQVMVDWLSYLVHLRMWR